MNHFDDAFALIGGVLAAVTLLVGLLTWLETTLMADDRSSLRARGRGRRRAGARRRNEV